MKLKMPEYPAKCWKAPKAPKADSDWMPAVGKPGSYVQWTERGVQRDGQVWAAWTGTAVVIVVPFERREGEQCVELSYQRSTGRAIFLRSIETSRAAAA